jgi:hypothetical protein
MRRKNLNIWEKGITELLSQKKGALIQISNFSKPYLRNR